MKAGAVKRYKGRTVCALCTTDNRDPRFDRLRAGLAVIGAGAHGLGLGFAHVLAGLGLAVPPGALAMVDLAAGIDPHFARAATGGRGACGGGFVGRGRHAGRRCHGAGRCLGRALGAVPFLDSLMARAGAALVRAAVRGAVLAQGGNAWGGRSRRAGRQRGRARHAECQRQGAGGQGACFQEFIHD